MTSLSEQLAQARRARFVGREAELNLFKAALSAEIPPFNLIFIYGPSGVGKTALLEQFAELCRQHEIPAFYVSGHLVEPTPNSFLAALGAEELPDRFCLFVDNYERLGALDGWLREKFLPGLPRRCLTVIAGIRRPTLAWLADPGWAEVIRVIALRNLSRPEARRYLKRLGVPPAQHGVVLDFTHGHPLALALVADLFRQNPEFNFRPEAAPDVVRFLLEKFLAEVPSPAHRLVIEAASLVRTLTEPLLAVMLGLPEHEVWELFDWLRQCSFVEAGPHGLSLHDLVREVLATDLKWRNPDRHTELLNRARSFYVQKLRQTKGPAFDRFLLDYMFLHRNNPAVRPFYAVGESYDYLADVYRPEDRADLEAMVARHEGPESARLFAHWLERQPRGVVVFRDSRYRVAGFILFVALHEASPEDLAADPGTRTAWAYLEGTCPLRPGEGATMVRFWMDRDRYQGICPVQSLVGVQMVRHIMTTPGLAFSFLVCADPDFWGLLALYTDFERLPEADFEVGGRRYGVYGHDWRARPLTAWLSLMAEREAAFRPLPEPQPAGERPVVLAKADFWQAVRQAFRDFHQGERLKTNPLLKSRLVLSRVEEPTNLRDRVEVLRRLLLEAAETLKASPRQAKLFKVLYHIYLQPAESQERAAELLNLPLSTLRYQLTKAIEQAADFLWNRELEGS